MNPPKQDQHKIPQVYLRKFGYKDMNNQWKVSVRNLDDNFTRQKSIESFTAVTNIFDIVSDDPKIERIFEKLNCDLETEYNAILADLEKNGYLSDKSYAYLLQLIANLIVRSDYWRQTVLSILNNQGKIAFLKIVTGHLCKSKEEFQRIDEQPFFKALAEGAADDIINRVLLYFLDHLMKRLWYYEITIIQSQEEKPWPTSTNPVVIHNSPEGLEILPKESELYFPVSPQYMAYLHFKGSSNKENPLRALESNKIYLATDEQNIELRDIVLKNHTDFVILAGEVKWRKHEGLTQ